MAVVEGEEESSAVAAGVRTSVDIVIRMPHKQRDPVLNGSDEQPSIHVEEVEIQNEQR